MAGGIRGLRESEGLNREFTVHSFPSYIDGSLPVRLAYSLYGLLRFWLLGRNYDIVHLHTAEKGSTFRKSLYLRAAKRAGAPDGAVGCITITTMEATNALLTSRDVGVILATGGEAMVRAAYSSRNPAIGVGPGNGPAYIEKTADVPLAVKRIFDSKTFDNGTILSLIHI